MINFIEVKPKDEILIEKIYKNEIESFGELGGADMWMIKSFVRYGKLFVLVDNDKLLAVAQFQKVFHGEKVFLYGFSTVTSERNKGYGKLLLEKCHKKLFEYGIKEILLTVDPRNDIAIELYKKMGYIVLELQKDEYGKGIDRYLMKKEILKD